MFKVAYDQKTISFDLLPGMVGREIHPRTISPLPSPREALTAALENPSGSPSLSKLVQSRDRVCVVIPDTTRPFPTRQILRVVLDYLLRCGLADEQVSVAIAYGLHRHLSPEEKARTLGEEVVSRFQVVDHDATTKRNLIRLGETSSGVQIVLHRAVVEADLVLGLGVVEPHQYAGYSGGAKTVAIGMAGAETIQATHSTAFLDDPKTGLGSLRDNPFSATLWEIVSRIHFKFAVNIIADKDGKVSALAAGDPKAVHQTLVDRARHIMLVTIPHHVDMVVAGIGHPKDVNLYQASRAVTYLAWAPTPILKPNGVIIIAAHAREGVGRGTGEQNFYHCYQAHEDIKTMLDRLRQKGFAPGAQRAYMLGKALMHHKVFVVGATCPYEVRKLGMTPFTNMVDALTEGKKRIQTEPAEVLVVPHALQTLPTLAP